MTTIFCPLDGILTADCPHVCCVRCGAVTVCGGCFKCPACHDGYSECSDWGIQVEVVVLPEARERISARGDSNA